MQPTFKPKRHLIIGAFTLLLLTAGCRREIFIVPPTPDHKGDTTKTEVLGFYLLNEGNMGSNKASLDYYNYSDGIYLRNIFAARNPSVAFELGDVGNDLQIYGSRLYAVINASNMVVVMNAADASYIGKIDIPNCRYIVFEGGKAYVSSYVGPIDVGQSQRGKILEVDTASLQIEREAVVGYQPDEMAIVDGRIYVANSGGYNPPTYDNTLSVVDIASMTETGRITVGINSFRVRKVGENRLYVSSRGTYDDVASSIYVVDTEQARVVDQIQVACSNIAIAGDTAYVISNEFNWNTGESTVTYALIDTRSNAVLTRNFIQDGTEASIVVPYGIAVHPITRDIFISDSKEYVVPGELFCFTAEGRLKWKTTTGDIPSSIAFFTKISQ